MSKFKIPEAPNSITKGVPLKSVIGKEMIECMSENIGIVYPDFDKKAFVRNCLQGLEPLSITERGRHVSKNLKQHLPGNYTEVVELLLSTLTPPLDRTEDNGLAPMYYWPFNWFVAENGQDKAYNGGDDPFEISMKANYELTKRFTSEFSIRPFIIDQQERTFKRLYEWMHDPDPHIRRLTTEGTRPRLPWATKIQSLAKDPTPSLKILELLKDDEDLYVRRSVANHVGDIAKDHPELAFDLCEKWLEGASTERKWVIRHALRNPAKKKVQRALDLRVAAK